MSTQSRKYLLNLVNFVNGKQINNYEIQLFQMLFSQTIFKGTGR